MSKYSEQLAETYPTLKDLRRRTKELTTVELPKIKEGKNK